MFAGQRPAFYHCATPPTKRNTSQLQTSVFGKIMEQVVAAEMTDYLLWNKLLNTSQHGFLSKRSTLTNLLESLNDLTICIENKLQNRVAYIDFSCHLTQCHGQSYYTSLNHTAYTVLYFTR